MKTTSPHPRQEPEMASCFVMTHPITLGLPDIAQCLSSTNKLYTTDRRLPLTRGDLRHSDMNNTFGHAQCTLCTMLSKLDGTQFFVFSQYRRRPVGLHKKYLLSFVFCELRHCHCCIFFNWHVLSKCRTKKYDH